MDLNNFTMNNGLGNVVYKKCAKNWKQEIIKRGHLEEEVSLL